MGWSIDAGRHQHFAVEVAYNHINHLDMKLNEVVDSVVALEHKFVNLEQKIEATIQAELNKNMTMLIVVIGAFLTLSKIIDKF